MGAGVPGNYSAAALDVDARLADESDGRFILFECRVQRNASSYYRLTIGPATAQYSLIRSDEGRVVQLIPWQASSAIQTGLSTNHVELNCSGNTISAAVNENVLASIADGTYQTGAFILGAHPRPGHIRRTPADARHRPATRLASCSRSH